MLAQGLFSLPDMVILHYLVVYEKCEHLYYTIKTWNTLITFITMITNNLERQAELENNDLDEDLVDSAFATDNWF